jgi:hypothetical protein
MMRAASTAMLLLVVGCVAWAADKIVDVEGDDVENFGKDTVDEFD